MKWWNALMAAFDVLRKGKELANAEVWKNRTVATNLLLSVLASLLVIAKSIWKPQLDIDNDTLQQIAAGIVAIVGVGNGFMHLATSARVGVPADSSGGAAPGSADDAAKPSAG